MVWHLHIRSKLMSLDPPEVLSQIWPNLVKKFKPPEWPLLEVRRFFQWCQRMSLGILKRFREKNAQFFFRDFNFGWKIQRLLQMYSAVQSTLPLYLKVKILIKEPKTHFRYRLFSTIGVRIEDKILIVGPFYLDFTRLFLTKILFYKKSVII